MNLDIEIEKDRRKKKTSEKARKKERIKRWKKKGREIIIALFAGVRCGGVGATRDGQNAQKRTSRRWPLNRATRVKGRTSGANVERKPSLIKDKGISATSRLVVTTTFASHSPPPSFEREAIISLPFPLVCRDPPRYNP